MTSIRVEFLHLWQMLKGPVLIFMILRLSVILCYYQSYWFVIKKSQTLAYLGHNKFKNNYYRFCPDTCSEIEQSHLEYKPKICPDTEKLGLYKKMTLLMF